VNRAFARYGLQTFMTIEEILALHSDIVDVSWVTLCQKRLRKRSPGSLKTLNSGNGTKGEHLSFNVFMPVTTEAFGNLR
jgi:hypothetical protein